MNVKSTEKNGNKMTFVVEIDAQTMDSGAQKAYLKARKNIMLPGFRKGKAPRKMIEAMYGAHVFYEDGLEEIFPDVYDLAVVKQEIKAVGRPSLTDMQIADDGSCTVTFTTDVYPEVTLGAYKGIEVEKEEAVVTDTQVQLELDRMANNVASTETVERAAKMGDTANIDFLGTKDGVPFDGGKGENYDLKLGSGSFVPGFEEQVVGMSAGEEKDIDITFPENYHEDLAGKAVVFHVKVNKVTETNVPEQDDEFAKDVSEFDTLDALKADIRAKALENTQKRIDADFEQACVDKAAENTTVDIPEGLIEAELDNQMERFAYQLRMSGYTMEQYAKMMGGDMSTMRKAFRPAAEKQARANVTLAKIIEVEGIAATEDEIAAEYEDVAKKYELELDKVKQMVAEDELKNSIETRKAVKLITDAAVAVAPKKEEEKKPAPKKKAAPKKTAAPKEAEADAPKEKKPAAPKKAAAPKKPAAPKTEKASEPKEKKSAAPKKTVKKEAADKE